MADKTQKIHDVLDKAKTAGEIAKIVCPKCGHKADKAVKIADAVNNGLSIFDQFKGLFGKK